MTSYVTPKKNTAFKFYVSLVDQSNTKLMKANPTIAAGDFKSSLDGAAFGNLATLPSANPASGRAIMIDLSAAEMNGDNVVVQCVDAAGAEWCDLVINIQTSVRQIDDLAFPATSGRSIVVDAAGLVDANTVKVGPTGSGTAQTARDIGLSVLLASGQKVDVDTIKTNPVVNAGTVTFPTGATLASTTNITAGTIATVTTVTNQLTAAQIATGVWQDTTAGDFTTALSIGKSVMNGVALGTGLTINGYTGNTPQTGDSFARIGGAGVGLTGLGDARLSNLDATVSSRASSAALATVQADTDDIQARLPAALTGAGYLMVDAKAWNALPTVDLPLAPTTAGRKLTVSAGGMALIDYTIPVTVGTNNDKTGYGIGIGGITVLSFAVGAIDANAIATDAIGSAEIAASAVTKIQAGLSTYAGGDTSGTTTLLARGDAYAALVTTARGEPGQGSPAASMVPLLKLDYLFKQFRNKKDQTATTFRLYADDETTVDQKSPVSDDGVTAVRGEVVSGP